jgi:hypothetical protein
MEELKIPFGLSANGNLVSAENATKEEVYRCPACFSQLIHRSGEIRVKHFSHSHTINCNLETILHKTAKHLVRLAIENNAKNNRSILLLNNCNECGANITIELKPQTFSNANTEVTVSDYICDVVGYRKSEIALAIEVLVTHKVDVSKSENLLPYWIEVKAEEIINDSYTWKPTQKRLKPNYCIKCKNHFLHVKTIAEKWGIDSHLYSPIKSLKSSNFIADIETCFKCKEVIPVFWWQGTPFCQYEPPTPKPKTIKFRNSKQYGGSYWANTCANCNMLQGDNFLFLFSGAPFQYMEKANYSNYSVQPEVTIRQIDSTSAATEFIKTMYRDF